ncbi:MAG: hypothetical protein KGH87_08930 [Thaumarchaeota archaeon]|nr:hypothetical protein [Nitrososphaerota archaeon]
MVDPHSQHLSEYRAYLSDLQAKKIPNITEAQRLFRIESVENAIKLVKNAIKLVESAIKIA